MDGVLRRERDRSETASAASREGHGYLSPIAFEEQEALAQEGVRETGSGADRQLDIGITWLFD